MGFDVALTNVIITLLYIIPGYFLCKIQKASADHLSTMSAVLIYICAPCMVINAFLALDFTTENFLNMWIFFAVTLVLQSLFMLLLFIIFRSKYGNAKYRIFTIASVMGNVGFFGLPVIKALLPNNPEVMCYSTMYTISMNLLVYTMGVFCLTGNKKYMTLKTAIFNPTMFGMVVGMPLYILGLKKFIPTVLLGGIELLSGMTTPLCMLILGIRLATVPLKKLFTRPFIYLICISKLLVFPLFCYGAIALLPFDPALKASVLILSGVPCASIILNLAEIHHSETELSANCVLVTTLLCFITIPLLTLFV